MRAIGYIAFGAVVLPIIALCKFNKDYWLVKKFLLANPSLPRDWHEQVMEESPDEVDEMMDY